MAAERAVPAPPYGAPEADTDLVLPVLGGLALVLGSLTAGLSAWMHGLAALPAPLLGPWAGLAIGHSDCTMAHAMPQVTLLLTTSGLSLGLGLALARALALRLCLGVFGAVWLLGWCATALLSMVNGAS